MGCCFGTGLGHFGLHGLQLAQHIRPIRGRLESCVVVQLNAKLDTSVQLLYTALVVYAKLEHVTVLERKGPAHGPSGTEAHVVQKRATAGLGVAYVHLSTRFTPKFSMQTTDHLAFERDPRLLAIDGRCGGTRGGNCLILRDVRGNRVRGHFECVRCDLGIAWGLWSKTLREAPNLHRVAVLAELDFGRDKEQGPCHVQEGHQTDAVRLPWW